MLETGSGPKSDGSGKLARPTPRFAVYSLFCVYESTCVFQCAPGKETKNRALLQVGWKSTLQVFSVHQTLSQTGQLWSACATSHRWGGGYKSHGPAAQKPLIQMWSLLQDLYVVLPSEKAYDCSYGRETFPMLRVLQVILWKRQPRAPLRRGTWKEVLPVSRMREDVSTLGLV
jgi:hypothetical protein